LPLVFLTQLLGPLQGSPGLDDPAALGQPRRADDAEADAVPGAVAAEAIRAVLLAQLERRALDVLPAERAADGDAEILSGDLLRPQAVEPQPSAIVAIVSMCVRSDC
jgi:hypothetical protein